MVIGLSNPKLPMVMRFLVCNFGSSTYIYIYIHNYNPARMTMNKFVP